MFVSLLIISSPIFPSCRQKFMLLMEFYTCCHQIRIKLLESNFITTHKSGETFLKFNKVPVVNYDARHDNFKLWVSLREKSRFIGRHDMTQRPPTCFSLFQLSWQIEMNTGRGQKGILNESLAIEMTEWTFYALQHDVWVLHVQSAANNACDYVFHAKFRWSRAPQRWLCHNYFRLMKQTQLSQLCSQTAEASTTILTTH